MKEFGSHLSYPKTEKAFREARRMKETEVKPVMVTAKKGELNMYFEITMSNGHGYKYVLTNCKNESKDVEKALVQCLNEKITADKVNDRLKALGIVFTSFCTEI